VSATTQTDIPEGGKVYLQYSSGWSRVAGLSVCTVSGLSAHSDGTTAITTTLTSTTELSITGMGLTASGANLKVSCTYMTGPTTASATTHVVNELSTRDEADNDINTWVTGSTCATNATVNASAAASTVAGVSSDWSHTISPKNIDQSAANGTFKFKVNQFLPKGSLITVAFPNNLSNALSSVSDLKNYCWCDQQYTSCTSSSNSIILTTAVDISSSTSIDVWVDDAFTTTSSVTASTTGFDITASWNNIAIIDDLGVSGTAYTTASLFTPDAAVAGAVSDDLISVYANNPGESSDYTFSFKVGGGYTVGDSIMIKFPREFDLFVGDAGQWFSEEPDVYYMMCSSTALGSTWC